MQIVITMMFSNVCGVLAFKLLIKGENLAGEGWTFYPDTLKRVTASFDKQIFESVFSR